MNGYKSQEKLDRRRKEKCTQFGDQESSVERDELKFFA